MKRILPVTSLLLLKTISNRKKDAKLTLEELNKK